MKNADIRLSGGGLVAVAAWGMWTSPGFTQEIEGAPEATAAAETQPAETQPTAVKPAPRAEDGPAYPVSAFEVRFVRDNPNHPPLEWFNTVGVELGWTPDGYVAPRPDVPSVTIIPGEAEQRGLETYYASAIQTILERFRDFLVARKLLGIYVAPDPLQISETGEDLRPEGETSFIILITTGVVTELRTLASGERVSEDGPILPEDRINHPFHQRIRDRSPIRPYPEGDPERSDLMRKDELDRYLFHLSRHPGRRVDASVAAAEEIGGVALDYQITENRPLVLYAQVSNTGTKSTDYWRERFGFFHTQLTNNDDVLSLDYITANFDESNAVLASYERPFENDRIRWRAHGSWSEFQADEVGFFAGDFEGESWALGGELIANIHQNRELFVDLVGGLRFENIMVDNMGFLIDGDEDFIIPHIALRLDRTTEWYSTQASAGFEWWLSDAESADLAALGRTAPDEDPVIFQASAFQSVYLEPLINREGWEDPATPETSTLAHEIQLSLRGQYAFDNRLIPQAEQVVGGLYTVRGYPESVVAGDSVIIGSVEYRYHLPRAFAIEPEPRQLFGETFRRAPQYVYGTPDWDLILKAFLDAGRTYNSDRLPFETDETLVGAGIGLEFLFRRNFNIRIDWGFVLEEIDSPVVNDGSNRVHIVATILF